MTGFLYAVASGGRVKIGFSRNPWGRFSKISSDAPAECSFLGCWPGSLDDESAAHGRFSHLRAHGEWFEVADDLIDFIKSRAIALPRPGRSRIIEGAHPLTEYAARTGRSFTDIAKRAGVSRMTLYRLVRGEQNARISLLEQISAATDFEVPASDFLPRPKEAAE